MGRHSLLPALAASLLLTAAQGSAATKESPLAGRTTTTSGQFVVYAKDSSRRSMLAQRAEAARTVWNTNLGADGNWSHPIIIQDLIGTAKPRGNPNALTSIFEGDGGALKIQTSIYDPGILRGQLLEREIFRALGLEWIYRTAPLKAGKSFRSPPAWLLEGLTEEERMRESGTPGGVYATLLRSEQPPKLDDFLRAKPELMEAISLTLYRTQSLALLRALRGLPEGGKGLGTFLSSLAGEDSDLKALLSAFPSLQNDPARLGKLWTLAIARDSASRAMEPLTVSETGRSLNKLLDLSAPNDPKKPELGKAAGPAALPLIARSEGGAYLMRQKSAELYALEFRSHPLIKPVIEEYRKITADLAKKPRRNVEKDIAENQKIFDLLMQRTGQVEDYMNWFEATQLDSLSEDFFPAIGPAVDEKRTDPISRHLDAVETRGW